SEPLAGDNNVDAPIVLQPFAIQAIAPPAFEPAAGDVSPMEEDPMDIAEISRRLNIMDPGSGEQSSQPEQAMAKIAKLQPHDFQAAPPAEQTLWAAHRGDSLRDVLARWSADSGAQLDWDAAYDYTVQADTSVNGTLEEAVRLLVERALGAGDKPVIAFLNGGGTPIMVVKDQAV
ncbi:MAG: TcpQ domain-containing protein, partial [Bdellovibrionales bacterium]